MSKSIKIMLSIIAFVLLAGVVFLIVNFKTNKNTQPKENTPVEEKEVAKTGKENLIRLISPQPETEITSPLVIKGEARGTWFFEASFPVILTDWDGRIIAETYATAKSDWMTEEFVPFEATVEFEKPEFIGDFSKRGSLILKKDNPSGLLEHDDALEITIFFKQ